MRNEKTVHLNSARHAAQYAAQYAAWLAPCLAVLLLAGCEAVYSPQPLGDPAVALDPAEWQGTWLAPDTVIITTVLDGEAGRLQTAWMERGPDGAKMEVVEGSIRATGDWAFANTLDEKEDAEAPPVEAEGTAADVDTGPRYTWLRLQKGENQLTAWSPNVEQFKVFVGDGRLPGRVTDDGVELAELTPAQLALINDPASGLLDWSNPAVFVRIIR
jgi:hypothetical protein